MFACFLASLIEMLVLFTPVVWAGDFRVTLLGTGTPAPRLDRFSQSARWWVGVDLMQFDIGEGIAVTMISPGRGE